MSNRTTFIDTAIAASETLTAALRKKKATESGTFSPATAKLMGEDGKAKRGEDGKAQIVPFTGEEIKKRAVDKAQGKIVEASKALSEALA